MCMNCDEQSLFKYNRIRSKYCGKDIGHHTLSECGKMCYPYINDCRQIGCAPLPCIAPAADVKSAPKDVPAAAAAAECGETKIAPPAIAPPRADCEEKSGGDSRCCKGAEDKPVCVHSQARMPKECPQEECLQEECPQEEPTPEECPQEEPLPEEPTQEEPRPGGGEPRGNGLLEYRAWWEFRDVDISVNGSMLSGVPAFIKKDTLRVINSEYSYFIPLEKVDYIRTGDGLESSFRRVLVL